MTRVEQRTLKLIEQLGTIGDLVGDCTRSDAAAVKRAARELASLLKRKPAAKAAGKASAKAAPAKRHSAVAAAAKTGRKASTKAAKRTAVRVTKDGRSLSDVRRAAAHKAWATKRQNARKRKA